MLGNNSFMYSKSQRFKVKTDEETALRTVFLNSLKHGAPPAGLRAGSGRPKRCVVYGGQDTNHMILS